jgi:hypothetical protein
MPLSCVCFACAHMNVYVSIRFCASSRPYTCHIICSCKATCRRVGRGKKERDPIFLLKVRHLEKHYVSAKGKIASLCFLPANSNVKNCMRAWTHLHIHTQTYMCTHPSMYIYTHKHTCAQMTARLEESVTAATDPCTYARINIHAHR